MWWSGWNRGNVLIMGEGRADNSGDCRTEVEGDGNVEWMLRAGELK